METKQLLKTLKIVVILALILGVICAVFYLIYGFTLLWQAMAAGIVTGFLLILLFILLGLTIYLWLKLVLLRRELEKCQKELRIRNQEDQGPDYEN
jgi:membrane protein implicated in regulation of membrane protease activity